jgi:DNA-binding protein HU-beta
MVRLRPAAAQATARPGGMGMSDKEKFWEEQLAHIRARIEATREAARQKGPEVLDRYTGELERLLDKYDAARYKFTLLRKGSGDALSELREGFEQALADLKAALAKARDKF